FRVFPSDAYDGKNRVANIHLFLKIKKNGLGGHEICLTIYLTVKLRGETKFFCYEVNCGWSCSHVCHNPTTAARVGLLHHNHHDGHPGTTSPANSYRTLQIGHEGQGSAGGASTRADKVCLFLSDLTHQLTQSQSPASTTLSRANAGPRHRPASPATTSHVCNQHTGRSQSATQYRTGSGGGAPTPTDRGKYFF
ncbi:MAG: hypothetical protein QOE33_3610, partial [Acidobacteriota bacterium]|nr:hypothetical protein [Acidobacteriota bacterium]